MYITQIIFLNEGEEKTFDAFEQIAIPLIYLHHGKLLFRLRPTEACFIGSPHVRPYEVHLVEFRSRDDYEAFQRDKRREEHLSLKERSVRQSIIIEGNEVVR